MMTKKLKLKTAILLFLASSTLSAQSDQGTNWQQGPIAGQFDYIFTKSGKYQTYKIISISWFETLKQHTLDSLKAKDLALAENQKALALQKEELEQKNTDLKRLNQSLETLKNEKESMSLLGAQLSKSNYNIFMWSLVALLIALLVFFVYKFKNSDIITKEAQLKLEELEEEYEAHRKRALEREQKVMRRLQDEINKQKTKGTGK